MGHVPGLGGRGDAVGRQQDVYARHLDAAECSRDGVHADGRRGRLHAPEGSETQHWGLCRNLPMLADKAAAMGFKPMEDAVACMHKRGQRLDNRGLEGMCRLLTGRQNDNGDQVRLP